MGESCDFGVCAQPLYLLPDILPKTSERTLEWLRLKVDIHSTSHSSHLLISAFLNGLQCFPLGFKQDRHTRHRILLKGSFINSHLKLIFKLLSGFPVTRIASSQLYGYCTSLLYAIAPWGMTKCIVQSFVYWENFLPHHF